MCSYDSSVIYKGSLLGTASGLKKYIYTVDQ